MTFLIYAATGILLFLIGLFGVLTQPNLVKKALALNITGVGVFMFLVAVSNRIETDLVDPIPHALVLTGIVVAVTGTSLLMSLVIRYFEATGKLSLQEKEPEHDA